MVEKVLMSQNSETSTINSESSNSDARQMDHGVTLTETTTGTPMPMEKITASNTKVSQTKNGIMESMLGLRNMRKSGATW
jgi:hypothetical protein